MRTSIAILVSLLWLTQIHGAPPARIGEIVNVSGNITSISASDGTISLGLNNAYAVVNTSVLNINGKRGNISDLKNGMKVSGSAEIAQPEGPRSQPKKIIRMLTATTDPADAAAKVASTPPSGVSPHSPSVMPDRTRPPTAEERNSLTKQLSGTFWTVPDLDLRIENGTPGKQWISLNPDGTTTCEREEPGIWKVVGPLTVQIQHFVEGNSGVTTVRFNAELNKGEDLRLIQRALMRRGAPPSDGEQFAWILNASPTQEMLAKAQLQATAASRPASTPAPPPTSSDTQQAAAEAIKTNRNNLVFVTGKEGAGSGFIANMDGTNYLVTNAHVAAGINNAGFKTLDGAVLAGGAGGVAVGHDIFRMALPPGGKPFEVMNEVDQNAGVGDDVVVLGNADGSGVVNTIMGKLVGIGPNLVEIDAQFVPGNSGSPIVHLKTGRVIGVATYTVTRKYDATTREMMKAPVVRRFGYRIDSVKTWQPVNWQSFYAQADAMDKVRALTAALDDFFRDLSENKNRVTQSRHTHPVIKTRISQWLESKGRRPSRIDRESADANFISFLKIACQTDLTNAQRGLTYDYFQRRLAQEQETRNEMAKAFTEIINSIRD